MPVWALVVFGRAARADPCAAAVLVAGDSEIAAEVAALLEARGLRTPRAGCPAVRATLEDMNGRVAVTIVDVDGRRGERTVGDIATATVLIESFAATDALAVRSAAPTVDPLGLGAPVAARVDAEQPSLLAMHVAPAHVRGAIGLAAESSVGSDGSIWLGALAHACVQLGPTCTGGLVRLTRDAGLGGDSEQMETSRIGYDVMLAIDMLRVSDRWSLDAGVGVGTGWLHLRRDAIGMDGSSDTVEVDAGGLRTELHVAASVPVARGVSLTFGATFGLAPGAHAAPYMDEGRTVAGEPRAFGRFGLGLELGRR